MLDGCQSHDILLIGYRTAIVDQHRNIISENFDDCKITACRPGLEVLETAAQFEPHLAVILADSDRYECLDLVDYLLGSQPQTYILFVAEKGERFLLERALAAGIDDFISGPPTADELILRVKRGLSIRAQGEPRTGLADVDLSKRRRSGQSTPAVMAKVAGNTIFVMLMLIMFSAVFFLLQSKLSGDVPSLFGYRIYTVLSGSMSPAFDTGSVIFVRPADPQVIATGDVITFTGGGDQLTTHRVVEIDHTDGIAFTTRGDANNVNDPRPVPAEHLVGRVCGSLPLLGYLLYFGATRTGLVVLIFIPAAAVITYELFSIYRHWGKKEKQGALAA